MKKNISDFFDWVIKKEQKKIVKEVMGRKPVSRIDFEKPIREKLNRIWQKIMASKQAKIKGL